MEISVKSIKLQPVKHWVTVLFYDEAADWHQSCETVVFIENDPSMTLADIETAAIQSAKQFLNQCLSNSHEQPLP